MNLHFFSMEVAIRLKVVKHISKTLYFEANPTQNNPTQKSFIRSVGLELKVIDIFWTPPLIIGNPRNTEKCHRLTDKTIN